MDKSTKELTELQEISINNLFFSGNEVVYQIPIYQRNYAWERDEIKVLVQDVYDAFEKREKVYFIGTLVSFYRGDNVFEIIDGQQRLTTIRLLLRILKQEPKSKLTYKARKRSDATLNALENIDNEPNFNTIDESDAGIIEGYISAKIALDEIDIQNKDEFIKYFLNNVHIIHYQVPRDIDLNHYFEVMNSRGEQLEKHEIVKANLMEKLSSPEAQKTFNEIWEGCCEMNTYIQRKFGNHANDIFSYKLCEFNVKDFDKINSIINKSEQETNKNNTGENNTTILNFIDLSPDYDTNDDKDITLDSFQPIIDFPNFLLIVLKITRIKNVDFIPTEFNLDDKEILHEFNKAKFGENDVKSFAFNLLKARYLLDNYIVHHSREDEREEDSSKNNPWKLECWQRGGKEDNRKEYPINLVDKNDDNDYLQDRLVQLLSMFEVSFTARQRKNYLFYCLLYLINQEAIDVKKYAEFIEKLADKYFYNVYLVNTNLNSINTPIPGKFDNILLYNNQLNINDIEYENIDYFNSIFGNGDEMSKGVPLFIFNYLDYKIWKLYANELRGKEEKEGSSARNEFFMKLGCKSKDFSLNVFREFYFSRTRRTLEHYYAQALADGKDDHLDQNIVNCFGNYAMIGGNANSSGSNWYPITKLEHYLDKSEKINKVGVSSLKFRIMMQICKDNEKWERDQIVQHQEKMIKLLTIQ